MSPEPEVDGIDDLLPVLEAPLWQGIDEAFVTYLREAFGLVEPITHVSITGRGSAGRSAVAATGPHGGIIFALTPRVGKQKTHVRPIVIGPIVKNLAMVARVRASTANDNMHAITGLALRHLPQALVESLLVPQHH